jgi:diacylglycerol kinase (ATP)
MRTAVIVNPANVDVPDLREQVDKTLAAAGWSTPLWLETTPEDPGPGMAEAAVTAGVQLVLICGGDGTVMGCLDALAGTDVPVAVVPLGTGNLLARNIGVPLRLADALAVAVNGVDRRIDLGRVADQPFAVMASIRFDAAMMADATEDMKPFAGWPAYVATGRPHVRDPVMRVRLRIDGGPPLRRGRCATGSGWRGGCFAAIARGDPHLERFRGCSIQIEADRIVRRQMDGAVIDDGRSLNA